VAERSVIEGFGPGVKKWASEETASEIAKTLSDMYDLSKSQQKELAKVAAKASKGFDTSALKDLEDALGDVEDAIEDKTEAVRESTSTQKKASLSTKLFSSMITKAGSAVGLAFGNVTAAMFNQANIVADLNRNGIQLSGGFGQLQNGLTVFGASAAEANLSFSELANLTKEYGATLNKFGIRAFAETSNRVTRDLEKLGISSAESSELVAEYLKARRFMTYQETLTQQQQTAAATNFIKQIDEYSMAFGEARTELAKSVSESLQQTDVAAFLAGQEQSVVSVFENMAAKLGGTQFADLRNAITEAAVNPYTQQTELFDALRRGGASDAMNALIDLSEAAKSGNQALSDIKFEEFMESLEGANVEMSQRIGVEGQALRQFVNLAKRRADLMENQNDFERSSAARVTAMQNSFRNISLFFERAAASVFGDPAVIEAMDQALTELSDLFNEAAPALSTTMANLIRGIVPFVAKLQPLLEKAVDKLNEWTKDLEKFTESGSLTEIWDKLDFSAIVPSIGGAIALAIGATAAGAIIGGAIASGVAGLLSRVAFGKTGGGGLFGNMFKGIGKGVGGALTALATGLTAFGKAGPAVLKGAVILAAVIPIIGAGIAGATWIMGKALPTFAEGLKGFEDLNGDNLAKVGAGVMKLGAGLAAMAAAKLGDLFGSIGESIFAFFGGEKDGPIELLTMFANIADQVGPGISKLGDSLQKFVPSLKQLLDTAADAKDIDLTNFMSTLDGLLTSGVGNITLDVPTVIADSRVIDTTQLESKIDNALGVLSTDHDFEVVTRVDSKSSPAEHKRMLENQIRSMYQELESAEKAKASSEDLSEIRDRINHFNDMLSGVSQINGITLDGERISREMALVGDSVKSVVNADTGGMQRSVNAMKNASQGMVSALSPEDIAKLESKRAALVRFIDKAEDAGRGNQGSMRMVKARLDAINQILNQQNQDSTPADFNGVLANSGISELPGAIDKETNSLEAAISRYLAEFSRLENIKPISNSARVEYSPLMASESNPTVSPLKPQYQQVDFTKPPAQIASPENNETVQEVAEQSTQNPEISNTNVAQRAPEGETEINTLIKEQNKILSGLTIAMETNNKRLKSLVRLGEERNS